jgi:nicotinic acid mononucleotide adenylyltransferase
LNSDNEENILYVNSNKETIRFENVLRNTKNLPIYKGSFNPPHVAHQYIANQFEQVFGQKPIFCISTKTYGKDDISTSDLKNRIDMLNKLGYDVLVSKKPMFRDLVDHIRLKYSDDISLLMGSDTFDRYLDTTPEELSVKYVVFQRPGMLLSHDPDKYAHLNHKLTLLPETSDLSSTQIRSILNSDISKEQKQIELEKFLDPIIVKHLL